MSNGEVRILSNTKGLSQVVTTVLIILVVLASIILIWAAVRPTIQSASEQITADCVTVELETVNCLELDSSTANVTVKRGAGKGDVTDIKFVFSGGSVPDLNGTVTPLSELETATYTVQIDNANTQKVNVAAVVGQGNICPESSSAPVTCTT